MGDGNDIDVMRVTSLQSYDTQVFMASFVWREMSRASSIEFVKLSPFQAT